MRKGGDWIKSDHKHQYSLYEDGIENQEYEGYQQALEHETAVMSELCAKYEGVEPKNVVKDVNKLVRKYLEDYNASGANARNAEMMEKMMNVLVEEEQHLASTAPVEYDLARRQEQMKPASQATKKSPSPDDEKEQKTDSELEQALELSRWESTQRTKEEGADFDLERAMEMSKLEAT